MQRFIKGYCVRKGDIIFICMVSLAWLSGLVIGAFSALYLAERIYSSLRFFGVTQGSVIVVFLASSVPLFICATLYWFGKPGFVFPIVACKAFCYGFCSQTVTFAFGQAGWIMRMLLMFADSFSVILFLLFLFNGRGMAKKTMLSQLVLCVAVVLVVICIDVYAVQPVLFALA